jgi:hypothetical protein
MSVAVSAPETLKATTSGSSRPQAASVRAISLLQIQPTLCTVKHLSGLRASHLIAHLTNAAAPPKVGYELGHKFSDPYKKQMFFNAETTQFDGYLFRHRLRAGSVPVKVGRH